MTKKEKKPKAPKKVAVLDCNENTTTVSEAKYWINQEAFANGAVCPCCSQLVKVYKRRITSSMAKALVFMERAFRDKCPESKIAGSFILEHEGKRWMRIAEYLTRVGQSGICRGGDFSKLRHWGLIEAFDAEREDGSKRNGYYTITQLGVDFVHCRVKVAKYIKMYNQKTWRDDNWYDNTVSIIDSLGKKFDYNELMSR